MANQQEEKLYLLDHKRPRIFSIGGLVLAPGINKVTESQWETASKHPLIEGAFDAEHIEWVAGKGPDDYRASRVVGKAGDPVAKDNPLSGLSVKEAVKAAKKIVDFDFLTELKGLETRKEVLAIIESQLEKVTPTGEDETEEDKD